jgi:hypothetical protein
MIDYLTKSNLLPTIGAIIKPFVDRVAATFTQQAGLLLIGRKFPIEFAPGPVAAFTQNERVAFFDPGHRNEKDLKIVIDALVICLVQTAHRTTPGIPV